MTPSDPQATPRTRHRCVQCDYDLSGLLPQGQCPECGGPAAPPAPAEWSFEYIFTKPKRIAGCYWWLAASQCFSAFCVGGLLIAQVSGLHVVQPPYDTTPQWWQSMNAALCFGVLLVSRLVNMAVLAGTTRAARDGVWEASLVFNALRALGLATCAIYFVGWAIAGSIGAGPVMLAGAAIAAFFGFVGQTYDYELCERTIRSLGDHAPRWTGVVHKIAGVSTYAMWLGVLAMCAGLQFAVFVFPVATLLSASVHFVIARAAERSLRANFHDSVSRISRPGVSENA